MGNFPGRCRAFVITGEGFDREMEAEVFKMAASQGFFAVLFVGLLFYVLRHNERREERLMTCLEKLAQQYESISHDVGEIKTDVEGLKEKVGA